MLRQKERIRRSRSRSLQHDNLHQCRSGAALILHLREKPYLLAVHACHRGRIRFREYTRTALLHKGDIPRLNDLHDADFLLWISDIDGIQCRLLLRKCAVDTDYTASASHSVARADNGSETRQCRPGMDSLRVRLDAFHRAYRSHAENSSGIRTRRRNESFSADLVCHHGGDIWHASDTRGKAERKTV